VVVSSGLTVYNNPFDASFLEASYLHKIAALNINVREKSIWRTPKDLSRTPGGTRTPGWEPLVYTITIYLAT